MLYYLILTLYVIKKDIQGRIEQKKFFEGGKLTTRHEAANSTSLAGAKMNWGYGGLT